MKGIAATLPLRRYRRSAAVVVAAAALATLAACTGGGGGGPHVAEIAASAASGSPAPSGSAANDPVAYSRCMRSHGVPNWPDPAIDSQGRPVFVISISKLGFDPYSRQVWAKGNRCSPLMPGLPGLPAAVSP
jgi:hypothetical protein